MDEVPWMHEGRSFELMRCRLAATLERLRDAVWFEGRYAIKCIIMNLLKNLSHNNNNNNNQ